MRRRFVLSLRLLLALSTSISVAASCLIVYFLVSKNSQAAIRTLTGDASQSVSTISSALLSELNDHTQLAVQTYFDAVASFAVMQRNLLFSLDVDSFRDPQTTSLLRNIFRNGLIAFSQPNIVSYVAPDGCTLAVSRRSGHFSSIFGGPVNGSDPILRAFRLSLDPQNTTTSPSNTAIPWDFRKEVTYAINTQRPPNALGWLPFSFSVSGLWPQGLLLIGFPYYSNAGQLLASVTVGCDTTWVSAYLREQAQLTRSVMFLVARSGALLGSSHGSITTNSSGGWTALPAKNSNDSRVAQGYQLCALLGASEFTLGEERYFCGLRHITDAHDLDLSLVTVTPRKVFFERIDLSSAQAEERRADGTRLTAGLTVVVLAICVLVVLSIAVFATRPLYRLASEMGVVGDLELAPHLSVASRFSEICAIQQQFESMKKRLTEYKSYMPSAIFDSAQHTGNGSDSAASYRGPGKSRTPRANLPHQLEVVRSFGSNGSLNEMLHTPKAKRTDPKSPGLRRLLEIGLMQRSATVLVVDSDGFNRRLDRDPLWDVARLHGLYVEQAVFCVQRNGGTVDGIFGDRFSASWNTFTAKHQHSESACICALEIQTGISRISDTADCSEGTGSHSSAALASVFSVRVAVTSGRVTYGRMGCESLRTMAVVGTPINFAHLLVRHCKKCQVRIVVDHAVYEAANACVQLRPIDIVDYSTSDATPRSSDASFPRHRVIYELQSEYATATGEWMYVLSQQAREQEQDVLSTAFNSLLRRDYSAALVAMDAIPDRRSSAETVIDYVRERVREMSTCNAIVAVPLRG
eukprot:TRINITY_DN30280_c0_g1_i1.p1 TRINITY_DN30280_c0_g1~~TRINITY_DN30280_c0_g1_i1.p1  ORF type:complete len:814 (+),score=83.78 TRINITY_DN30280_c0_g1_i1:26-2443(+)